MAQYLDGFVLVIPKSRLADYKKLAAKAGRIWRKHGALEYRECVLEDPAAPKMIPFPKLARAKPSEVVIFAYAVFNSRKHRDATNQKIMADKRLAAMCEESKSLVNCSRMAYGGFQALVSL